MNAHTKTIELRAMQALEKYGCTTPPVPIEKIAEVFELDVIPFPFHDRISGLLKKEESIIAVNKTHNPLRQRFTIAHELGHFLLGHEMGGEKYQEEMIDDSFDKPVSSEREANMFASAILMPREWIQSEVKKQGMNIEPLAKIFGVSKQAITIRLLELNLIK